MTMGHILRPDPVGLSRDGLDRDGDGPRAFDPRVLVGRIAVIALCLGLVSMAILDEPAARFAQSHLRALRGIGEVVTAFGLSGYMLVGAALVGLVALRLRRRLVAFVDVRAANALAERAGFVFATVAASGILAQLLKHLVGRARPRFIDTLGVHHFDLFSLKASLASFPSGHTASAFGLATALALIEPAWRWPLGLFAVAVGASRYLVGAHFPSDVIAGAALGSLVTIGLAGVFATASIAFTRFGRLVLLKDSGAVATRLPSLRAHLWGRR